MQKNQDSKNLRFYEAPRILVTALKDELPLLASSPNVKYGTNIVDPTEIDGGDLGGDQNVNITDPTIIEGGDIGDN